MLLDLHTHRAAPYPEGVISAAAEDFAPEGDQLYSVGIHPWHLGATPADVARQCDALRSAASDRRVVAVGEGGFDTVRGGAMMLQTLAFRCQVDLSEQLKKPLIIHSVKTLDMIVAWRKQSGVTQPWVMHGFRGKPQMAQQLLKAGCVFSFGENFNAETLRSLPADVIFAETDESALSIEEIIGRLSAARDEEMLTVVAANTQRLLGL